MPRSYTVYLHHRSNCNLRQREVICSYSRVAQLSVMPGLLSLLIFSTGFIFPDTPASQASQGHKIPALVYVPGPIKTCSKSTRGRMIEECGIRFWICARRAAILWQAGERREPGKDEVSLVRLVLVSLVEELLVTSTA